MCGLFHRTLQSNLGVITMKFATYRKKPVEVRAVLLNHDVEIDTLEGKMKGFAKQHYLVIGIEGEKYCVRKDIFEKTYERINK